MRVLLVSASLLFAAACGSSSVCDNKTPGNGAACDPGTLIDSAAETCADATGAAYICRNGTGYCVICTGVEFNNGCMPNNSAITSYCVHSCSDC